MTIQIAREETRCCHFMGYSFRIAARVLLYTLSCRQDSTCHGLCYTSRGALAETKNNGSDDPSHNKRTLLPRSYISLLVKSLTLPHSILCCVISVNDYCESSSFNIVMLKQLYYHYRIPVNNYRILNKHTFCIMFMS